MGAHSACPTRTCKTASPCFRTASNVPVTKLRCYDAATSESMPSSECSRASRTARTMAGPMVGTPRGSRPSRYASRITLPSPTYSPVAASRRRSYPPHLPPAALRERRRAGVRPARARRGGHRPHEQGGVGLVPRRPLPLPPGRGRRRNPGRPSAGRVGGVGLQLCKELLFRAFEYNHSAKGGRSAVKAFRFTSGRPPRGERG